MAMFQNRWTLPLTRLLFPNVWTPVPEFLDSRPSGSAGGCCSRSLAGASAGQGQKDCRPNQSRGADHEPTNRLVAVKEGNGFGEPHHYGCDQPHTRRPDTISETGRRGRALREPKHRREEGAGAEQQGVSDVETGNRETVPQVRRRPGLLRGSRVLLACHSIILNFFLVNEGVFQGAATRAR